jgi:hypothetical protein
MEYKEVNIENDAIRYANTQPKGQRNAAKLGYMAGAMDYVWEGDESLNKDEVAAIYKLIWDSAGENPIYDRIRSKLEMADVLIIKRIENQ